MKRLAVIVVLIALPITIILGIWEWHRCRTHDLPLVIAREELSGSPGPLIRTVGAPDRRYKATAQEIYRDGIGDLPVRRGALGEAPSRTLEVLLWERTCFCVGSRFLALVISPKDKHILYWNAWTLGGQAPFLVFGSGESAHNGPCSVGK